MTVVGWYGENAGGTREMRKVTVTRLVDPERPLRSMIEAAQHVYTATGNKAEAVQLTEAEWALVEKSDEVKAAGRFCFHEERDARDVVAGVTGLTVEVGRPAWQR